MKKRNIDVKKFCLINLSSFSSNLNLYLTTVLKFSILDIIFVMFFDLFYKLFVFQFQND